MTDFFAVLAKTKKLVWPEIEKYLGSFLDFPQFCQIPDRYGDLARFHQKLVADYPKRQGKYLRPTLVLLTAQAMGFAAKKAIKTAAAMQVSEDWILNHDDIEDDSLERRGKPTLHRLYGKELAINAGDSLHAVMWKILTDNLKVVGLKRGQQIIGEFYQMLNRTVLGQTVEIKWTQAGRTDLTDQDIFFYFGGQNCLLHHLAYGQKLAEKFSLQAKKIFEEKLRFLTCQPARQQLLSMMDFIIQRSH